LIAHKVAGMPRATIGASSRSPTMKLQSLCQRPLVTIDADQTLQRAAQLMREQHVGALVIVEPRPEGTLVAGIVTDRDLAIEVLARGGDVAQVPVGRLAGGTLVSAGADADLADAVARMQAAGVRRLLLHDAEGHLLGLVSFDDLLQACVAPLPAWPRCCAGAWSAKPPNGARWPHRRWPRCACHRSAPRLGLTGEGRPVGGPATR
jgi:CBS domain-containing protein